MKESIKHAEPGHSPEGHVVSGPAHSPSLLLHLFCAKMCLDRPNTSQDGLNVLSGCHFYDVTCRKNKSHFSVSCSYSRFFPSSLSVSTGTLVFHVGEPSPRGNLPRSNAARKRKPVTIRRDAKRHESDPLNPKIPNTVGRGYNRGVTTCYHETAKIRSLLKRTLEDLAWNFFTSISV